MVHPWALKILIEVAERGSFSAAAKALLLTQPAVSRQINGLEAQLRVPLFRREARGIALTAAGEAAVQLARGIVARLDAFEATMRTFTDVESGRLRVGGFASVNTSFLPEAIRRFNAEHPSVSITLDHVDPLGVLDAVRTGAIDVALVTGWQLYPDPLAARTDPLAEALQADTVDGVELTPLLDEELHVALPPTHRLARRRTIPLAELAAETWVEGAYPDCLGPIPRFADALGGPPRIGFVCDDWNGKQALVAGGAGIMVVPTLAQAAIRPDLVLRPTSPVLAPRRLFAASARPPFRPPAAEAMLELLRTTARTPSPVALGSEVSR
jgi:DNA-binding transcriptional LysR family regulator